MIAPEQKNKLIKAIKKYGEAEVGFGKAINDYLNISKRVTETSQRIQEVGEKFGCVIDLINKL